MKIGTKDFQTQGRTYVMGILNVTPDSFSDGGKWNSLDRALYHGEAMVQEGADILDIGGESTRPGYTLISDQEEMDRVLPLIEALKQRLEVPVSLDTYKSQVAAAGIRAGADFINDIWGLKYDPAMAGIIGAAGVPCCLMHNRKEPAERDFTAALVQEMAETLALAEAGGIAKDRIILDPGVGFGKTYEQNLEAIRRLDVLKPLGCPVLLGTSRKSVIGLTLNLPADQRVEGTLATTVYAVLQGCMFVRVHDVRENVRAIRMTEAILQGG